MILLLSSCDYKLSKTFDDYESSYYTLTKSSSVSKLDGASYHSRYANLAIFSKSDEYIVYNMENNSVVKTFYGVSNVIGFTVDGTPFILVNESAENVTKLYNESGSYIATAKGQISSVTKNLDLFVFDNTVYRVSGGSASTLGNAAFLPSISSFNDTVDGYYFDYSASSSPAYVMIYDSNLNLTGSWQNDVFDEMSSISVLSNGNVLIQGRRDLPEDAKKYDLILEGEKYEFTSYLMKPKNGKVKKVDRDFIVLSAHYVDEDSRYNNKIKNIATILPIEDKHVTYSAAAMKMVELKDNGKIKGYLFNDLPGYNQMSTVQISSNDRYTYKTSSGDFVIVNSKNKVIGTINGSATVSSYSNSNFIIINNVIYDWNLNEKYDLVENEMTVVKAMNNSLILSKDGKYYRYAGGALEDIGATSDVTLSEDYYIVKNGTSEFNLYNDLGTKIATYSSMPYYVTEYEGNYLMRVSEGGMSRYYLISK